MLERDRERKREGGREREGYLVAAMDCDGASALRVLDFSFLDKASNWSKFLCNIRK